MNHRTHPFCSDVILVMFVFCSFWPWSRAFVGINNTSTSRFAFPNAAVGFSTALYRFFARHCCSHRNFQPSPSGFHCELELLIFWFDEAFSSQLWSLSIFGFSMAHFCFVFFFAASDMFFHVSDHTSFGREVVCFLVSLLPHPDHVHPSCGFSFNRMNLVKPVHASDNSCSPSTFQ